MTKLSFLCPSPPSILVVCLELSCYISTNVLLTDFLNVTHDQLNLKEYSICIA